MSDHPDPTQVEVVRRYMAVPRCAHLIPVGRMNQGDFSALCRAVPSDFWRGGWGPEEIARAQDLPLCKSCQRVLTAWRVQE